MTETLDQAEIPEFPGTRAAGCPFDPPPALRSLQGHGPLVKVKLWDGSTPWLVTRHAEQRALLADPRVSADITRPGYPRQAPYSGGPLSFILMDDPEHARLRRMVTAPFARQAGGGPAPRRAEDRGRPHRRPAGRSQARRPGRVVRPAGALAGDLRGNPGQLALVRESDDPKLVAGAVEELLRYLNITHSGRRRVALEDIEIAGQVIRAGDGLIMPNDIANRDPETFPTPTNWTSAGTPACTWPSVSECTSAWASRWPGWNCRSSTAPFTGAFPRCAWRRIWTRSRSSTTGRSMASTSFP